MDGIPDHSSKLKIPQVSPPILLGVAWRGYRILLGEARIPDLGFIETKFRKQVLVGKVKRGSIRFTRYSPLRLSDLNTSANFRHAFHHTNFDILIFFIISNFKSNCQKIANCLQFPRRYMLKLDTILSDQN